ncbi:MAG: tetratricopeptide repeat protein [Planctomycetota bacterium]|nr:tetratricopeptide repeat protein [Planctomycetota bacterium]
MSRPGLLLLLLLPLLARPVAADEIVLQSGGRLEGEIVEITDERVVLKIPHGQIILERRQVAEIRREDAIDYLKREARSRMERNPQDAVLLYRRALKQDPADEQARTGLEDSFVLWVEALLRQHRLREAIDALEQLHAFRADHPRIRPLVQEISAELEETSRYYRGGMEAFKRGDDRRGLALLAAWRLRRPAGDDEARKALAKAHAHVGRRALEAGALRAALDHFRTAKAYGGGREVRDDLFRLQPLAVLEVLKEGDLRAARRLIDRIATSYPDPAVPVFLRAVAAHLQGEVAEAVEGYTESARLAEERVRSTDGLDYEEVRGYAMSTLREAIAHPPQEGVGKWREVFIEPLEPDLSSAYFTVYAPTDNRAGDLAEVAGEVYRRASKELLGRVPSKDRIEVVVHATRAAYIAADPVPPGSPLEGVTIPREQTGGCCYDTLGAEGRTLVRIEIFLDDPRLAEDTLPHEVIHAVQRHGLGAFRRMHWFDEGLATTYESKQASERRIGRLRQAGRIIPFPQFVSLQSTPPGSAGLFYDQAHALSVFLKQLGSPEDWRRFLSLLATRSFEDTIREAWGVESLDDLERQFLGWIFA